MSGMARPATPMTVWVGGAPGGVEEHGVVKAACIGAAKKLGFRHFADVLDMREVSLVRNGVESQRPDWRCGPVRDLDEDVDLDWAGSSLELTGPRGYEACQGHVGRRGTCSRGKQFTDLFVGQVPSKEFVAGSTQPTEVQVEASHRSIAHLHGGEVRIA